MKFLLFILLLISIATIVDAHRGHEKSFQKRKWTTQKPSKIKSTRVKQKRAKETTYEDKEEYVIFQQGMVAWDEDWEETSWSVQEANKINNGVIQVTLDVNAGFALSSETLESKYGILSFEYKLSEKDEKINVLTYNGIDPNSYVNLGFYTYSGDDYDDYDSVEIPVKNNEEFIPSIKRFAFQNYGNEKQITLYIKKIVYKDIAYTVEKFEQPISIIDEEDCKLSSLWENISPKKDILSFEKIGNQCIMKLKMSAKDELLLKLKYSQFYVGKFVINIKGKENGNFSWGAINSKDEDNGTFNEKGNYAIETTYKEFINDDFEDEDSEYDTLKFITHSEEIECFIQNIQFYPIITKIQKYETTQLTEPEVILDDEGLHWTSRNWGSTKCDFDTNNKCMVCSFEGKENGFPGFGFTSDNLLDSGTLVIVMKVKDPTKNINILSFDTDNINHDVETFTATTDYVEYRIPLLHLEDKPTNAYAIQEVTHSTTTYYIKNIIYYPDYIPLSEGSDVPTKPVNPSNNLESCKTTYINPKLMINENCEKGLYLVKNNKVITSETLHTCIQQRMCKLYECDEFDVECTQPSYIGYDIYLGRLIKCQGKQCYFVESRTGHYISTENKLIECDDNGCQRVEDNDGYYVSGHPNYEDIIYCSSGECSYQPYSLGYYISGKSDADSVSIIHIYKDTDNSHHISFINEDEITNESCSSGSRVGGLVNKDGIDNICIELSVDGDMKFSNNKYGYIYKVMTIPAGQKNPFTSTSSSKSTEILIRNKKRAITLVSEDGDYYVNNDHESDSTFYSFNTDITGSYTKYSIVDGLIVNKETSCKANINNENILSLSSSCKTGNYLTNSSGIVDLSIINKCEIDTDDENKKCKLWICDKNDGSACKIPDPAISGYIMNIIDEYEIAILYCEENICERNSIYINRSCFINALSTGKKDKLCCFENGYYNFESIKSGYYMSSHKDNEEKPLIKCDDNDCTTIASSESYYINNINIDDSYLIKCDDKNNCSESYINGYSINYKKKENEEDTIQNYYYYYYKYQNEEGKKSIIQCDNDSEDYKYKCFLLSSPFGYYLSSDTYDYTVNAIKCDGNSCETMKKEENYLLSNFNNNSLLECDGYYCEFIDNPNPGYYINSDPSENTQLILCNGISCEYVPDSEIKEKCSEAGAEGIIKIIKKNEDEDEERNGERKKRSTGEEEVKEEEIINYFLCISEDDEDINGKCELTFNENDLYSKITVKQGEKSIFLGNDPVIKDTNILLKYGNGKINIVKDKKINLANETPMNTYTGILTDSTIYNVDKNGEILSETQSCRVTYRDNTFSANPSCSPGYYLISKSNIVVTSITRCFIGSECSLINCHLNNDDNSLTCNKVTSSEGTGTFKFVLSNNYLKNYLLKCVEGQCVNLSEYGYYLNSGDKEHKTIINGNDKSLYTSPFGVYLNSGTDNEIYPVIRCDGVHCLGISENDISSAEECTIGDIVKYENDYYFCLTNDYSEKIKISYLLLKNTLIYLNSSSDKETYPVGIFNMSNNQYTKISEDDILKNNECNKGNIIKSGNDYYYCLTNDYDDKIKITNENKPMLNEKYKEFIIIKGDINPFTKTVSDSTYSVLIKIDVNSVSIEKSYEENDSHNSYSIILNEDTFESIDIRKNVSFEKCEQNLIYYGFNKGIITEKRKCQKQCNLETFENCEEGYYITNSYPNAYVYINSYGSLYKCSISETCFRVNYEDTPVGYIRNNINGYRNYDTSYMYCDGSKCRIKSPRSYLNCSDPDVKVGEIIRTYEDIINEKYTLCLEKTENGGVTLDPDQHETSNYLINMYPQNEFGESDSVRYAILDIVDGHALINQDYDQVYKYADNMTKKVFEKNPSDMNICPIDNQFKFIEIELDRENYNYYYKINDDEDDN